jgi:palmitoyltransferase
LQFISAQLNNPVSSASDVATATIQTIAFHCMLAPLLVSYFRVVTTDPGSIPDDWVDKHRTQDETEECGLEWCDDCQAPQPERAHHCALCQVQQTDEHRAVTAMHCTH